MSVKQSHKTVEKLLRNLTNWNSNNFFAFQFGFMLYFIYLLWKIQNIDLKESYIPDVFKILEARCILMAFISE